MPQPEFDEDAALETLIEMARTTMLADDTERSRRFWARRMTQFIADRSADQMARMEREKADAQAT